MEDLIDKYIDKLNFQTFEAVYRELEIIDNKNPEVNVCNSEFVEYCVMYAHKLLEKKRYKEVV